MDILIKPINMLKKKTSNCIVFLISLFLFSSCAQKMDVIYNLDTTKPLVFSQGSRQDTIKVNSTKWKKLMQFAKENRTGWKKREKGFISTWVLSHKAFNLGPIEDGSIIGINFKDENGKILIYQKEFEKGTLDFLIE